jgi:hypothetical protein
MDELRRPKVWVLQVTGNNSLRAKVLDGQELVRLQEPGRWALRDQDGESFSLEAVHGVVA